MRALSHFIAYKNHIITVLLSCCLSVVSAQEDPPKKYVKGVFSTTQLINAQTTEMLSTKGFEFKIQHRFGMVPPDATIYKQFLGLDLPANIRFGFGYAFSDRFYAEVGRTKFNKAIDLSFKYGVLKQTKDNSTPVSVALYGGVAMGADEFPYTGDFHWYNDTTTHFEYQFAHRISYNSQLIISRKFGHKFSLQIAPVLIYHNLVPPERDNHTAALPISGRLKVGLRSSFVFEYAPLLNNRAAEDHLNPFSIAYEIGTSGHIFQIVLSSSNNILEQDIYTVPSYNYLDGELLLGFNIKRMFWSKKKAAE